jgi:sugar lactone lactonase YvrE
VFRVEEQDQVAMLEVVETQVPTGDADGFQRDAGGPVCSTSRGGCCGQRRSKEMPQVGNVPAIRPEV